MKKIDENLVKQLAGEYFKQGYNCCQSVSLAFEQYVEVDKSSLLKLASPFGGGISRLRETCGAFSASVIIIGLLFGYETPETGEIKAQLYSQTQDFADLFIMEFKTLYCKELLNTGGREKPIPSIRNEEFYKTRPCLKIIENAAFLLAQFINNHSKLEI